MQESCPEMLGKEFTESEQYAGEHYSLEDVRGYGQNFNQEGLAVSNIGAGLGQPISNVNDVGHDIAFQQEVYKPKQD